MTVECFLDTNVLLYAVSSASAEAEKKRRALDLLATADFGLSVQVLQEFFVNATRKIAVPLTPAEAVEMMDEFRQFPLIDTDYALVVAGVEVSLQYEISSWDGAIIAAAQRLHAPILFSEDLNHGQRYGSVQVVNPFLGQNAAGHVHEPRRPAYGP